ncbi:MAG: hypothetical protein MAG715_00619 [Methanonatronarchaeales archaeon]|nr:hypothetical protein [Methanonatronarchaeales archaeon]
MAEGKGPGRRSLSPPVRLLVVLLASTILMEVIVMTVVLPLLPPLPLISVGVLDGLVLGVLVFPSLYILFFRPMRGREKALRESREALRRSEERYRELVSGLNDGVFENDRNGIITFANGALADIFGVESPEELVGRSFLEFLPIDKVEDVAVGFKRTLKGEALPESVEREVRRADGETVYVEVKPVPILREGEIVGVRGVLRDVTSQKEGRRETQSLLESRRRWWPLRTSTRLLRGFSGRYADLMAGATGKSGYPPVNP